MIKLFLGNIGSGKTLSAVIEITKSNKTTYSNIITKSVKNNVVISPDMIYNKEIIGKKKTGEIIYNLSLNEDFWRKKGNINVVLDEAHSLLNARNSNSKPTRIMLEFLALLRRILGSNSDEYGTLILITQLDRRLDVVARDLATQVRYHICHYRKVCKKCGFYMDENNEMPELIIECPVCNNKFLKKENFKIEIYLFNNIENYQAWKYFGKETFYRNYYLTNVEKFFDKYDTFQWDNLMLKI